LTKKKPNIITANCCSIFLGEMKMLTYVITDKPCQSYKELCEMNDEVITTNANKFNISASNIDNALEVIEKGGMEDLWDNVAAAAIQENTDCQEDTNKNVA